MEVLFDCSCIPGVFPVAIVTAAAVVVVGPTDLVVVFEIVAVARPVVSAVAQEPVMMAEL